MNVRHVVVLRKLSTEVGLSSAGLTRQGYLERL